MALIRKTILWICLMSCIGHSKAVFVDIGVFPAIYELHGVNLPHCGIRFLPNNQVINYDSVCYLNPYRDQLFNWNQAWNFQNLDPLLQRIAFGTIALPWQAPWAVYILFYHEFTAFQTCSGSLITFEWVVTAAHCLYVPNTPDDFLQYAFVFAGSILKGTGDEYRMSHRTDWVIHSYYNRHDPMPAADIALIKVNFKFAPIIADISTEGVPLRYYSLNTICVPTWGGENAVQDVALFSGFGKTEGDVPTESLIMGYFVLSPFSQCQNQLIVCSHYIQQPDPRPCVGDSGGGLYQFVDDRATLVGPLHGSQNTTPGCGIGIDYSEWVSVPRSVQWILDTIVPTTTSSTLPMPIP